MMDGWMGPGPSQNTTNHGRARKDSPRLSSEKYVRFNQTRRARNLGLQYWARDLLMRTDRSKDSAQALETPLAA